MKAAEEDGITGKEWIEALVEVADRTRREGRRLVVIAVARKMARLLEYHIAHNPELEGIFKNAPDDREIITEHAIPLALNGATPADTEVVIVDDLVVFGDTVTTISENVFALTGIRAKVVAMAVSVRSTVGFRFADLLYPAPAEMESLLLSVEDFPAYTAKNSRDILSLQGPVDLEHTIISVKKPIKETAFFQTALEKALKEIWPEETVYSIVHTIPGTGGTERSRSVSICFESRSDSPNVNNDFNKIRFFISRNGVRIVSFAPNICNETLLEDDSVMYNSELLDDVWRKFRDRIKRVEVFEGGEEYRVFMRIIRREFKLRQELTAVVFHNYLVSFDNVMLRKEKLVEALAKAYRSVGSDRGGSVADAMQVEIGDLTLILGKELSNDFLPKLSDLISERQYPLTVADRINPAYEQKTRLLIPDGREEEFHQSCFGYVYQSPTVETALSLIFYALWSEYGLVSNIDRREDNVKVGVTFEALRKELGRFYKDEREVNIALNRWIDRAIDLGIVVPKYEFTLNRLGYRQWRRYFRAGEREDDMVGTSRETALITRELFPDAPFRLSDFEEIIIPELKRRIAESDGQLPFESFGEGVGRMKGYSDAVFFLWIYMEMIGAYRLTAHDNWKEARLNTYFDAPKFERSALY